MLSTANIAHMNLASRVAAPIMTVETPKKTMNVDDIDVDSSLPKFGRTFFPARDLGDYGFDPLGLSEDNRVVPFRHAELKHGRLAMLAAVAWPLQEILHPIIVDALRSTSDSRTLDVLAETGGMSPSLLNGGLEQFQVLPALSFGVFLGSVLELKDIKKREAQGLAFNEYKLDSIAGDEDFDPLNIGSGLPADQRMDIQKAEMLNGRLAMLAVTSYVLIEFVFGQSIVSFTPDLFQPLFLAPDFRAFMDASFGVASMDGSIDGVAY